MGSEADSNEIPDVSASPPVLNRTERWDIICIVLAFSCVVANLTLVVGTGVVVILSVGGSASLAPFAVAVIFLGMSAVSLTMTHWIFARWGRKVGFWVGCGLGLIGTLVGSWGLVESSSTVVLLGQFLMGGGLGIGMYLRYFAVEVVPPEFAPRAISWVLGGGCIAAFIGPEMSQLTKAEVQKLRNEHSLKNDQIKVFERLHKEYHEVVQTDELLELYRHFGYNSKDL